MLSEDEVNLNKGVSQLYSISTPGCMGWLAIPSGSWTCVIPSIVSVGIIHLYLVMLESITHAAHSAEDFTQTYSF